MRLTSEQLQIVNHPLGAHGKVLSVAGSGKTTTMAYRVKHLIEDLRVNPRNIQVLMFNRHARTQFQETLIRVGFEPNRRPPVDTFHSYAYRFIQGHQHKQWFGETEELVFLTLNRAITNVCRKLSLDRDYLNTEEAKQSIDLWKGSLIPPKHAGHQGRYGEDYVEVYKEFERLRREARAITFDDFVPMVISHMMTSQSLRRREAQRLQHIIVDEYQDVNFGQQKLIELMASEGADALVVGDDDQTIYEWRGARKDFILREFQNNLSNKRHITYKLTQSFRFGYSIAQSGYNVILHNSTRFDKNLVSSNIRKDSEINLYVDREDPDRNSNRRLTEEIIGLVRIHRVKPSDIRVLARTYSQLDALSTEFLMRKVPFKVVDRVLFVHANECQTLLDYARVAAALQVPLNVDIGKRLVNIANKPSRYLRRNDIERMVAQGSQRGMTIEQMLQTATRDAGRLPGRQQENLQGLSDVLQEINHKLTSLNVSETSGQAMAGPLFTWIDSRVGYREHYKDYYGEGETAVTRIQTIETFIGYAQLMEMDWRKFISHVNNADSTLGRPESQWIKMMTVHKTKGLEFDYVFIPNCSEGYMPVISNNDDLTFDKRDPQRDPAASEWIENERRLFYVALTRAKRAVYIGTTYQHPVLTKNQSDTKLTERKPSRFLEEIERPQTFMVSKELASAARGDHDHRLIEVCQGLNAYHHIVRLVKDVYASQLPTDVRRQLSQVELSSAERPFAYKLQYDTPSSRFDKSDTEESDGNFDEEDIWEHIKL